MKRSTYLNLCFYLTLATVVTAMIVKVARDPSSAGAPGGDALALISPIFFVMAAKRATRFGSAAVVIATIGLLFGLGAAAAVLTGGGS